MITETVTVGDDVYEFASRFIMGKEMQAAGVDINYAMRTLVSETPDLNALAVSLEYALVSINGEPPKDRAKAIIEFIEAKGYTNAISLAVKMVYAFFLGVENQQALNQRTMMLKVISEIIPPIHWKTFTFRGLAWIISGVIFGRLGVTISTCI